MSDPVPAPHPLAVMLADREKEVRAARPNPEEEEDSPMPVVEKECTRCHEVKPAAEFNKGSTKSGLHSWCKECVRANNRARSRAGAREHTPPAPEPVREPESQEPTTTSAVDPDVTDPDVTSITWVFTGATITSPFDPTLSQLRRLQAALRDDLDPGLDYDLESVVAVATVVLDALKDSDA